MDPSNDEVDLEFIPYVRTYKSGRVERLKGSAAVPAAVDSATGVTSKDVVIDPATGLSARLYLPDSPTAEKLPVLVYYHGGAFIVESAFSSLYHTYLNLLAAKARVLVVSVDYRRAPEHPLPAAYHDSWAALQWVVSAGDAWLAEHGDLGKIFLAGDSAGGNIAHHMALRAGAAGVPIEGLALVHPFFWGREPVGDETRETGLRGFIERLWGVVCPASAAGVDDPMINPLAEGAPGLAGLACRRAVVFVAGKDALRVRGRAYYEGLVGSGWGGAAEFVETEGEDHVFHLFDPTCEKASALMGRMVEFLKRA